MLARRSSWAVFAVSLALVPACSLPRSVIASEPGRDASGLDASGFDAGPGHDAGTDAASAPDMGIPVDAYVGPDTFIAPDGYVAPDAYTAPDAYVAPDAYAAPDAYVAPDAYTAPDAFVAPDAWTGPRSCDAVFGSARDYERCSESATECQFFVTISNASCNDLCASFGASCTGAFNNGLFGNCSWGGNLGCSDTGYTDLVCTCTHIP